MKKLSEYTKLERRELYNEAKKIYMRRYKNRTADGHDMFGGMCDAIYHAIHKQIGGFHPDEDIFEIGDELPEMRIIKPEKPQGMYWWPEENAEIRIKMFNEIIKMTEI